MLCQGADGCLCDRTQILRKMGITIRLSECLNDGYGAGTPSPLKSPKVFEIDGIGPDLGGGEV